MDRRVFGTFVEHMGRMRLHRHLRAGAPDGRRVRLPRGRRRAGAASWAPRSCATRAATSSPATAGRTASVRWRSGRSGSTSPGRRSRPTTSGLDEFTRWCRVGRAWSRSWRSTWAPAASRRRWTCSSTATTRRYGALGPATQARARRTRTTSSTWCLGNELDGPWQVGAQDRAGVRPARRRDRAGRCAWSTPRSSWSPAAAPTARCRRSPPGRRPSSSTATTLVDYISLHSYYDPHAAGAVDVPGQLASTWTGSSTRDRRDGRPRRREAASRASSCGSRSTSGTSGTSRASTARTPALRRPTRADRGRLRRRRRRGGRLAADHPAAPRRPGARSPARRSWSTSSRRSSPAPAAAPGRRRSSIPSPRRPAARGRRRAAHGTRVAGVRRRACTARCRGSTPTATYDDDAGTLHAVRASTAPTDEPLELPRRRPRLRRVPRRRGHRRWATPTSAPATPRTAPDRVVPRPLADVTVAEDGARASACLRPVLVRHPADQLTGAAGVTPNPKESSMPTSAASSPTAEPARLGTNPLSRRGFLGRGAAGAAAARRVRRRSGRRQRPATPAASSPASTTGRT